MERRARSGRGAFYEETCGDLLLLRCRALAEAGFAHAFATRAGGVSTGALGGLNLGFSRGDDPACVRENYRRLAAALAVPPERLFGNRQVHGDAVRVVAAREESGLLRGEMPQADALATADPGAALCAYYADCVPILIADPESGAAAAVHAGWRGTASGIVQKAAERLAQLTGGGAQGFLAAIGPSICADCYTVGAEVEAAFRPAFGERLPQVVRRCGDALQADLWEGNRLHLLRAGLSPENIHIAGVCTAENPALYFSHRRMGDARGVHAAVIVCRGGERRADPAVP